MFETLLKWNDDLKVSIDIDTAGIVRQARSNHTSEFWEKKLNRKFEEIFSISDKHNVNIPLSKLFQKEPGIFICTLCEISSGDTTSVVAEVRPIQKGLSIELTSVEFFIEEFKLLRESELRFRGLYDNLSEGVFLLDSTGLVVDWNQAACKIYERRDFYGAYITELFPHNTSKQNEDYWIDFMNTGTIEGFYRFNTQKGVTKYIEFSGKSNVYRGLHLAVFADLTEKKNTEKALLQSQANLKTIFDNSDQNIMLIDPDYTLIAVNPSARNTCQNMMGKEIMLPSNVMEYVVDKELFKEEFEQAKSGTQVMSERPVNTHAGQRWFEYNLLPIFDSKGAVKNICYTINDITLRKREALMLEDSEKRFRQLAENSPDIIYIIDLSLRKITYINRPQIFGYNSQDLMGPEVWREIVYPDDVTRVEAHWQRYLTRNNDKVGSIEYRIRTKEGDYEWVNNRHLIVERDKRNEPLKVLLNFTVITERKQAEDALRESESKLTALIENTSDLVWSVDKNLSLTAINSAFRQLIQNNYRVLVSIGDKLTDKIKAIGKDGWLELHRSALNGKKVTAEFSWVSAQNENLFYEITYNPIHDANEEVTGVSVFARDITQRKINEAVIIQTNFELDSFVYRASHDLRAPLRSILGLASIIKTEAKEVEKERYLSLIEKSAHKLDNFISDLINFSRNSRMQLDIEEVDFSTLLAEAREHLRFMEDADRVKLEEKIEQKVPFYSDPKRISIFLNNLLSNSIKYQTYSEDRKPKIDVIINVNEKGATIIVEDNGIGIQEEYISKIFNMFFRASEKSFGSGLGLYIVKQSVEKLGGSIRVESRPNKGTRFEVSLPNKSQDL